MHENTVSNLFSLRDDRAGMCERVEQRWGNLRRMIIQGSWQVLMGHKGSNTHKAVRGTMRQSRCVPVSILYQVANVELFQSSRGVELVNQDERITSLLSMMQSKLTPFLERSSVFSLKSPIQAVIRRFMNVLLIFRRSGTFQRLRIICKTLTQF